MLWLIPAGTHLRIGTLRNSFSPTTSPAVSEAEGLLSDSSLPDRLVDDPPALSDAEGPALSNAEGSLSDSDSLLSDSSSSLSDSDLLAILRKEENYEVWVPMPPELQAL
jgi:hypothetical protein